MPFFCLHTLCDNCSVYAEWNVLFFPLLKSGMSGFIDVRLILLLVSGIKVYSYTIKVFSTNRTCIGAAMFAITNGLKSQLNNEQGTECVMFSLN